MGCQPPPTPSMSQGRHGVVQTLLPNTGHLQFSAPACWCPGHCLLFLAFRQAFFTEQSGTGFQSLSGNPKHWTIKYPWLGTKKRLKRPELKFHQRWEDPGESWAALSPTGVPSHWDSGGEDTGVRLLMCGLGSYCPIDSVWWHLVTALSQAHKACSEKGRD